MPFGAVTQKLGISNARVRNAASFAETVLRLPMGVPVCQQQLVHNTFYKHGPNADAAWCPAPNPMADSEAGNTQTLREISPVDTMFARKNLSESLGLDYRLTNHISQYSNQIYYLLCEPEIASNVDSNPSIENDCNCWDPRNRLIDQLITSCFPNPSVQFWEPRTPGNGTYTHSCGEGDYERIRAEALAYAYLHLKSIVEGAGHILLPPSSSNTLLGSGGETYELDFYDAIHKDGVSIGGCTQGVISPASIYAIHIHRYSELPINPLDPNPVHLFSPLVSVAWDAAIIRSGVAWYEEVYSYLWEGEGIPLDVLLSEFGYDWELERYNHPSQWAGGWLDFRAGLSWWNSYLCWLTRFAPTECNLAAGKTVHSCIHIPEVPPYTTANNYPGISSAGGRNQWYLNTTSMSFGVLSNQPSIRINGLNIEQAPVICAKTYQNSFLKTQNAISWDNKTWRTTPFGACYTVWAQVGSDPIGNDLNNGWVYVNSPNIIDATVNLPAGYSTVFFPVIKDFGYFDPQVVHQVFFRWKNSLGQQADFGHMTLNEIEDTTTIQNPQSNGQDAYSAMIYPVTCFSANAQTLTVELSRSISVLGIWLGRPIVLLGICSWFIDQ